MPLALTWYDWFKTGHVLAAVVWVGGGTTLTIYALLTLRQDTPAELASFARKAALIGKRVYTPLSLLVLAFGFGLMANDQARGPTTSSSSSSRSSAGPSPPRPERSSSGPRPRSSDG